MKKEFTSRKNKKKNSLVEKIRKNNCLVKK